MAYVRKTRDEYEVQIDYGYGFGFERITSSDTYAEAKADYCDYVKNERDIKIRIKKVRVKIEQ